MSEETKKCRECQMDVPKKARRCPHCRSKQGIGAGGILVAIIFTGMVSSVVMSSLNDARSNVAAVSNFELGTYIVESEEFKYMNTNQINLWQSYSDRTLTGKVSEGDIVEVTIYDDANDYCHLTKDTQSGWTACGWLIKTR